MMAIVWLLCLGLVVLMLTAAGRGIRVPGSVSWFVVLPQMQEPTKKAKGRMQQRRKRRR